MLIESLTETGLAEATGGLERRLAGYRASLNGNLYDLALWVWLGSVASTFAIATVLGALHRPSLMLGSVFSLVFGLTMFAGALSGAVWKIVDGVRERNCIKRWFREERNVLRTLERCGRALSAAVSAWNAEASRFEADVTALAPDASRVERELHLERASFLLKTRRMLEPRVESFRTRAPKIAGHLLKGRSLD